MSVNRVIFAPCYVHIFKLFRHVLNSPKLSSVSFFNQYSQFNVHILMLGAKG